MVESSDWEAFVATRRASTKPSPARGNAGAARRLVKALSAATAGRPQQWRSLIELGYGEDSAAVRHAVGEGWLLIEGGHSVCLTDAGRWLTND